jgi:hypothetical protein
MAVTESEELAHVGATLSREVRTRDPAVDRAVLDVLGDVRGPDEQDFERRTRAGEGECSLVRGVRCEAGVLEQVDRRLPQPAFDRQCESQPRFARSIASR